MELLARSLSVLAMCAIPAAMALYYSSGLSFQLWPDSFGYLAQAQGLAGLAPYSRPADRNVGYPLLVAAALLTPRPALAIVLVQGLLAVAALSAVYRSLTRTVLPRVGIDPGRHAVWSAGLLAAIAAGALYSGLHVHVAALLTETLFAATALAAVLAAIWLVRPGRVSRTPRLEAAAVAVVGAMPLLVKPHWMLAAPLLAAVAGGWLWWRTSRSADTAGGRLLKLALALAVTVAAALVTVLPDRLLGARHSPREHALFGPRSAFCNHAHLVHATLARRPGLVLQNDQGFEASFRSRIGALVASHTSGWGLLGYNGDLCTYSGELTGLLDARYPEAAEQGRFLLQSLATVALADPLPYARKVLVQVAHGFLSGFDRFAIHTRTGIPQSHKAGIATYPPPAFFAGVHDAEEVGPLGSRAAFRASWCGPVIQALLAVLFHAAKLLLVAAVLATLLLPLWRWRVWTPDVRQTYLAFLALPLAALLAHHGLIALVHSFDVWRYGFNVFFVNLYFMGAAALFWHGDLSRWRGERA